MLVLSRRVGESLVIGDEITITVLEQRGDVVRIGVDAPRHIQVRRQELLAEVAETNRAAASPAAAAIADLSALMAGTRQPAPSRPPRQASAPASHRPSRLSSDPEPRPAPRPAPRPGPPRRSPAPDPQPTDGRAPTGD